MNKQIIALDPSFNFDQAYKRNYCTLINFQIVEASVELLFRVDGIINKIAYPEKLFHVIYREWQNQNWFKLEGPVDKEDYYWKSASKATDWLDEMIKLYELEKISTDQAFKVAQLSLNL